MPQFFVKTRLTEESECRIRGADARHITGSLRLKPGDSLVISDGAGRSFNSRILSCSPGSVALCVLDRIERSESAAPPALAMASVRRERLELAVAKAVELGCRRLIIFNSMRTVRTAAALTEGNRIQRLSRIAIESAKQSGMPFMPDIEGPLSFLDLCARLEEFDPAVMMHEEKPASSLREAIRRRSTLSTKPAIIMIGPEGGFADEEAALAASSGAVTAGMGPQILRAETAAIAAFAIFQYELGNMEKP